MAETFDVERLLKPRLPEGEVEVEGFGTFRVRALSRAEVLNAQSLSKSPALMERRMVSTALVSPPLSENQVGAWQAAAPPGEIEGVTNKIMELSGMDPGAAKAHYRRFEADSAEEFPVLPGERAGDDGGTAP